MLVNLRRNSTSAGKKTTIYNTSAYSRFQQSHPDRQIRRIIKRIDMRTKRKEKKTFKNPPSGRERSVWFYDLPTTDSYHLHRLATSHNYKKRSRSGAKIPCLHQIKILYSAKKKTLHFVLGLFAIRSAHFGTWYSASPRTRPPTLGIARKK